MGQEARKGCAEQVLTLVSTFHSFSPPSLPLAQSLFNLQTQENSGSDGGMAQTPTEEVLSSLAFWNLFHPDLGFK